MIKRFFVILFILILLLSTCVFADDIGYFNTGLTVYDNWNLYFDMDNTFLSTCESSPYWNDNYYKIVFLDSPQYNNNSSTRVARAWFISKNDTHLNLSSGECPFYFNIGTSSSPGNTYRSIGLKSNLGAVTIHEIYKQLWSGGSSGTSTFTNDYPVYYCLYDYNNSSYVKYYFLSDYYSSIVYVGGVPYQFTYTNVPTFINPTFDNYDDTTTWGNSLTTGEFYNFVFYGNSANELELYFLDNTYTNSGGEDVPSFSITLNPSSQYYDSSGNKWVIPINDINVPYMNSHTYEIDLVWDNNGIQSSVYSWTTNFSSQVIADISSRGSQSINNMDNYLNNNFYNKEDIVDSLPSSLSHQDITQASFNSIFTSFYNAFTNTTTQTVRFEIPNSNGQYIDIPSNLVTSRIPNVILVLIQSFYWFMFSRFILKDIAKTVNDARSGKIMEYGSDDGNIKTDIL